MSLDGVPSPARRRAQVCARRCARCCCTTLPRTCRAPVAGWLHVACGLPPRSLRALYVALPLRSRCPVPGWLPRWLPRVHVPIAHCCCRSLLRSRLRWLLLLPIAVTLLPIVGALVGYVAVGCPLPSWPPAPVQFVAVRKHRMSARVRRRRRSMVPFELAAARIIIMVDVIPAAQVSCAARCRGGVSIYNVWWRTRCVSTWLGSRAGRRGAGAMRA